MTRSKGGHSAKRAIALLLVLLFSTSIISPQIFAQDHESDTAYELSGPSVNNGEGDGQTATDPDSTEDEEEGSEATLSGDEDEEEDVTDPSGSDEEEETTPDESETSEPQEGDGELDIEAPVYDEQPASLEEVQAWIDAAYAAYTDVLAEEGAEAALAAMLAAKPHWQEPVSDELMPKGYNCQLVPNDDAFGAPYYTFFAGIQALAATIDRSTDPNWASKVEIGTEAEFKAAMSNSTRAIILTSDISISATNASSAPSRAGDLTIFGDGHTLTFASQYSRLNLTGSGALTVYDLDIVATVGTVSLDKNNAGIFCAYSSSTETNSWTADFYNISFEGTALVGSNHSDSTNFRYTYFSRVNFYENNKLTAKTYRASNAVVFARNVTISGKFEMENASGVGTSDASNVSQFFRSVSVGNPTSEPDTTQELYANGTFKIADNAEVSLKRTAGSSTAQSYIRSLVLGYESFVFGEGSEFYALANTNRVVGTSYASSVIFSQAAKEFMVESGAKVTLETGEMTRNSGEYGYNALMLRKTSTPLTFTVEENATLHIIGNGAFGDNTRARVPVAIMGEGSSNTTIYGTFIIDSANGNGWYYRDGIRGGTDNFTIDGGTVQINANGKEGNRATETPGGASSPDEYAAFEHYGANALTLDVINGGKMLIQSNGWRAMSMAGTNSAYPDKIINVNGAGSQLLINAKEDASGKPTHGAQFAIAAEGLTDFAINITNGGEMYARNTQDSTIYTVGRANYLVSGAGSKLTLIKTGENSSGTQYSLYGSIFHDGYGALDIKVLDGATMWTESTFGHRATITAQSYSAGQHNILVDGSGSSLTVINHNEDLYHLAKDNRHIEDSALYPIGAIAFAANTSGNITVSNGADFYAESHNPISPTIALSSYYSVKYTGLFTANNPGEIDIRNDGTIQGPRGIDIRGIALRSRDWYEQGNYQTSNRGRGAWRSNNASDNAETIRVQNASVAVYQRNGGFDKQSFEDWGNEHVIRSWSYANFSSMNVGTTTGIPGGVNGAAVSSGSSSDSTSFTLPDYGRIYIRGVFSTKTVSASSEAGKNGAVVKAGDIITYDITYINNKDVAANLVIRDVLPIGLEYVSHEPGQAAASNVSGNTVTWRIDNIPAGGSGTVSLKARVTEKASVSVTNTANLTWTFVGGGTSTQDPSVTNPVEEASSKYVSIDSEAGLDGKPVRYGEEITYEIRYINNTGKTSSVTITDELPQGVAYVGSTGGGVHTNGTVKWEISGVAPGGSGTVTVTVKVTEEAEATILNQAKLVWSEDKDNPEEPNVEIPVGSFKYVPEESDVGYEGSVVKSSNIITYKIKYINNTGEDNVGVTITDPLPAGLTSVSNISNGGWFDATTQSVVWNITGIAKDGSGEVSFKAVIDNNLTGISQIINKADLLWKKSDGSEIPEEAETTNPAINPTGSTKYVADISAAGKNGAPVNVGDIITYQIAYINSTGHVASVTITDTLSVGLELISADGATISGNTAIWAIPNVPVNGTGVVTLTAKVTEAAGPVVKNDASLVWTWTGGGGGTDTETPSTENPVGATKYVDTVNAAPSQGKPVTVGDKITYKIWYVNTSASPANVTITDTLPKGLEFVSATKEDGGDATSQYNAATNTITWNITGIAAGDNGYVTVTVKVTEDIVGSTTVTNKAKLAWSTGGDPEEPEVPVPVGAIKYVASGAGVSGTPVAIGDEITYTIAYVNNTGKKAAVTIADELPTGVKYLSNTGGGVNNNGTVTWKLTDIAPGATGQVTVTVQVTQDANIEIINEATLKWTDEDGGTDTETPGTTNPIGSQKYIDDGPGKDGAAVHVGDEITYTISYYNHTGDTADVKITDNLPLGVRFVSATDESGTEDPTLYNPITNTVTWEISGVLADTGNHVKVTVKVLETVGPTITNKATVEWTDSTGETQPPEEPSITTPVESSKYIAGESAAGAEGQPVRFGEQITYGIKYINNTGRTADLTITDVLPKGVKYVSSTDGSHSDGTVTWNISRVAAGETGIVKVTVEVTEDAEATIFNKASLKWSTDGDPETPGIETPVGSSKFVSKDSAAGYEQAVVSSGDEITYVIRYVNNTGKDNATVKITDVLPAGVDPATVTGITQGGSISGGTITWIIPGIAAGGTGTVSFTVRVAGSLANITTIINKADLEWLDGGVTEEVEATNPAILLVASAKYVTNGSAAGANGEKVYVGDIITYEITYINRTGQIADLTITDELATGLEYISSSHGGNEVSPGRIAWEFENVPVNGFGSVTLTVRVTEAVGGSILNEANLKWSTAPNPEVPGIEIPVGSSKYVDDGISEVMPITIGDEITYTIKYINNTGADTSLTITDDLPTGLKYISDTAGGIHSNGTVTWFFSNVEAGKGGIIKVKVLVTDDIVRSTTVINKAKLVWGNTTDPEEPEVPVPVGALKYVSEDSAAGIGGTNVAVGDVITYAIDYTNNTGKVAGVTITDKLPTGLEYIGNTGGGVYSNGTVTWTKANLQPKATGTVTITVKVTPEIGAEVVNEAKVRWKDVDGGTETEEPNVTNPVESSKYISADSPAGTEGQPVRYGDIITYEIMYVNNTGIDNASLTITDNLPGEVVYVDRTEGTVGMSSSSESSGTVTWSITDIPEGAVGKVTVTVKVVDVTTSTTISNAANLTWTTGGTPENPDVDVPVGSSKYVTSVTGANGAVVSSNDTITYTIRYINNTGKTANLTITDILPAGLVNPTSISNSGAYNSSTNTITWIIPNLAAGASGTVSFAADVADPLPSGISMIINRASLAWEVDGKVLPEDVESTNPAVNPVESAKYVAFNSAAGVDGATVYVGDIITYEIAYVNQTNGPLSVDIVDYLPKGVEYIRHTTEAGALGNPSKYTYDSVSKSWIVTWDTITNVGAHEGGTVSVTVRVTEDIDEETELENKATLTWGGSGTPEEPNITNPLGSRKVMESVNGGTVTKTVQVGDQITYALRFVNNTGDEANLIITDVLRPGLKYISSTGNLDYSQDEGNYNPIRNDVQWELTGIPAGATGMVTVTVEVTEEIGAKVRNEATFVWNNDSDGENPGTETPVGSSKYISGDSEAGTGGAMVYIGDVITYEIRYVNTTGSKANVTITDTLPNGLEYVTNSASHNGSYTNKTITWTLTDIENEASGVVTFSAKVTDQLDKPTITNKATLAWSGSGTPEEPSVETPVGATKYVSGTNGQNGTPVSVGDRITYTIWYANQSDSAKKLVITDELKESLEYVTSSVPSSYDSASRTVTWDFDTQLIPAGASGSVTVTVEVTESAEGMIKNEAKLLWGDDTDPEIPPPVVNPITSVKYVSTDSKAGIEGHAVMVGDEITYTITYVNNTGHIANLVITDTLGKGLEYVSSEPEGVRSNGGRTITWGGGSYQGADKEGFFSIPAGHHGSVKVTVLVTEEAETSVTNQADFKWTLTDTGTDEDEDSTVTNPLKTSKYILDINGDTQEKEIAVGDELTYEIRYINNTGSTATNVKITDTLPRGMTYVSSDPQANHSNGTVTWDIDGTFAPGASGKVKVTVQVTGSIKPVNGYVINKATVVWDNDTGNPEEPGTKDKMAYTVTYHPNGGTGGLSVAVRSGKEHIILNSSDANVSRSDYRFLGWGTSSDSGVTDTVGRKITVNNDVILYAQWEEDDGGGGEEPKKYTVTYDANGGEGSHKETDLTTGSKHTVLTLTQTEITREGWTFTGWNTQPNGNGTAYTPGQALAINGDVTLYAQWKEGETYTVTYHANGGTGSHEDTDLVSGAKYNVRSVSATKINRVGYVFTGWNTQPNGSGTSYTQNQRVTIQSNMDLYAQWTPGEAYTVTYNANGGTGSHEDTNLALDQIYQIKSNTTIGISRRGHTFRGWNTEADGSGTAYLATNYITITKNVDLFAQWSENSEEGGGGGGGGEINPSIEIGDDLVPLAPFSTDHFAYIIGYPDSTVRPDGNIVRSEVTTVFFRLLSESVRYDYWGTNNAYPDVALEDWFNNSVSVMTNLGVITGYPDGSFGPKNYITRAELATIAARFAILSGKRPVAELSFNDVSGHWAEEYINYAASMGWINGYNDGSFRPSEYITRAEFIAIVNRMQERTPENTDDLLPDMKTWPDNADTARWFYLDVQAASNSYFYEYKDDMVPGRGYYYETWTELRQVPDWSVLEKPTSQPYDLVIS